METIPIYMVKKYGRICREEHRDCQGTGSGQMQVWGMDDSVWKVVCQIKILYL